MIRLALGLLAVCALLAPAQAQTVCAKYIQSDGTQGCLTIDVTNALPGSVANVNSNKDDIVVTKTEHHDVKAEVIEHVARLLCEADGCNADADIRCSMTRLETVVTCDAIGMTYPSYLGWYTYRDKAEKKLQEIFSGAQLDQNGRLK